MTLAEIRDTLGASGVRDAILRALAAHPTVTAAAESLGTTPYGLRRAARRVKIALPERPRTPGTGTSARTAQRRRAKERAKSAGIPGVRNNRQG